MGISVKQSHTSIMGNTVNFAASWDGIELHTIDNCTVIGNIIINTDAGNNDDGVELESCTDIIVSNNIIQGFQDGVDEHNNVKDCSYNMVVFNNFRHCTNGFTADGTGTIDSNNMEP